MKHLSLRQRLIGFAALAAIIALLMGGVGYAAVRLLTTAMNESLVSGRALQNHTQVDLRMDALRADVLRGLRAAQTGNDAEKKAVSSDAQEYIAELRGALKDNLGLSLEPEIASALAKVVPLVEPFIAAAQKELDLTLHDSAAASANYDAFIAGFSSLEENMDATRTLMRESVAKAQANATATASIANGGLLTVLAAGLLLIVGCAFLITRAIVRPLTSMTAAMTRLAGGDVTMPVPALDRTDEIGAMAAAVQVFKEAAIENARLEHEAQQLAAQAEGDRGRNEQAQRQAIEQERTVVASSIGAALAKLAAKDLTFRMPADIPEAYRKLQADFNEAIAQLEEAMQGVTGSTEAIQSGTREISIASDDLSRRTERQAASLEETAAALDEITATVKKSAEGATHARQVAAAADDDAKKSAVVVRQAVDAMDAIAKSARQISQIIGVIDEIAFQTNLLALNAGVEAARAGDAGRGFAVVASEVRALAQRSADAAKEIKGLISTSTAQVDQGVKLVAETGKSLGRIMSQVAEINGIVGEIAAGAKEQATALQEVNSAINQMDQATQQNAAMVEESTAASHSLSQETTQLSGLIDQFQVGRAHGDDSMRRQLQKAAPHAFRQPAKVPAASGERTEVRVAASNPRAETRKPAGRSMLAPLKAMAVNGSPSHGDTDNPEQF